MAEGDAENGFLSGAEKSSDWVFERLQNHTRSWLTRLFTTKPLLPDTSGAAYAMAEQIRPRPPPLFLLRKSHPASSPTVNGRPIRRCR
jgi:hypothetical protein